MPPTIRVTTRHAGARKRIKTGVMAYSAGQAGPMRVRPFLVTVSEGDEVQGGAVCSVRRGWLYVEYLWIDEALRGQDFGTRVMDLAEARGRALGAHSAYLITMSFQAPEFYLKRGYTVFGVQDDFPTGHQRLSLSKRLDGPGANGPR